MMEHGDIAPWGSDRYILVLEGVLASNFYAPKRVLRKPELLPPDEWFWQVLPMKHLTDKAVRLNLIVEVVTFDQALADPAAEWLARYGAPASDVYYADFNLFTESLKWRSDVMYVVDSDPDRIQRYGQKGFLIEFGGGF